MARPQLLFWVVCMLAPALAYKGQLCSASPKSTDTAFCMNALADNRFNNKTGNAVKQDILQAPAATATYPSNPASTPGSYIAFLLFVIDEDKLTTTFEDEHFKPVVVLVTPGEIKTVFTTLALLAQHRAQFMLSVGNRSDFDFLAMLPAQVSRAFEQAHFDLYCCLLNTRTR